MADKALVVVFDDERRIGDLVRAGLTREGYDVIDTPDAETALGLLDQALPDLMIVDMKMPRMDGTRFVDEAKTRE